VDALHHVDGEKSGVLRLNSEENLFGDIITDLVQ
jgi:hypothetical protein